MTPETEALAERCALLQADNQKLRDEVTALRARREATDQDILKLEDMLTRQKKALEDSSAMYERMIAVSRAEAQTLRAQLHAFTNP